MSWVAVRMLCWVFERKKLQKWMWIIELMNQVRSFDSLIDPQIYSSTPQILIEFAFIKGDLPGRPAFIFFLSCPPSSLVNTKASSSQTLLQTGSKKHCLPDSMVSQESKYSIMLRSNNS